MFFVSRNSPKYLRNGVQFKSDPLRIEKTIKKAAFDTKECPRVTDLWRLRNDTRNVVAYKCSVLGHVFKVLTPFEASIIPLFDGTNTFDDIINACFEIYTPPPDFREQFLDNLNQIFEGLMSIKGFLTLEGPKSPSLCKSMVFFIPDFANYFFPAPRLERPLSVQIAFTNRCICDCRYCYAEKRACPEANLDQWKNVFDELVENEIFLVDIAGGDIFARDDALTILEEMVARDFTFFLSTKSLISRDAAERLAEMGIGRFDMPRHLIRRVQVSVDSANGDVVSFLVRRSRYLKQATQSIVNLLQVGIAPRIKCVLTSFNADAPKDIVHNFSELGVTDFDFVYYTKSYYCHDDALFLSWEQKLHLHETANRLKTEYPTLNITFQDETKTEKPLCRSCELWHSRAVCSGGRSNMIIQPNGDVTLCDQIPHRDPFVVGNVFDQGVLGVWQSPKLIEFLYPEREKFTGTACFDCSEFDECIGQKTQRGYCYRDALFYYGSIYDAPPECPWQYKDLPRKT